MPANVADKCEPLYKAVKKRWGLTSSRMRLTVAVPSQLKVGRQTRLVQSIHDKKALGVWPSSALYSETDRRAFMPCRSAAGRLPSSAVHNKFAAFPTVRSPGKLVYKLQAPTAGTGHLRNSVMIFSGAHTGH